MQMMDIPEDEETCCGCFTIDKGQTIIGTIMCIFTFFVLYMTIAYMHLIFFLPLLLVCGLYCFLFLYAKKYPSKDNADSRRVLYAVMALVTCVYFLTALFVANEIFNDVPKEVCEHSLD